MDNFYTVADVSGVVHFCIDYDDSFEENVRRLSYFIVENPPLLRMCTSISYHIVFDPSKRWSEYPEGDIAQYEAFIDVLAKNHASKVVQCSLVNKYNKSTVYITEKEDLVKLGQEIQGDVSRWPNLRVFDYGENCIRFLPGVKFPNSLEVLNIGGGDSLETLAGFKMPPKLRVLNASRGMLTSIDYTSFPLGLESLDLLANKLFFLNYVELPRVLRHLDLSQNNIESLKSTIFPKGLKHLSISNNPIDCIKGVRFPESVEYLDVSCIPNESMTGIKFPDNTIWLNLQQSMTNTRGLKLPPFVKELNMAGNGVNSINPLKLPNSIEKLFLANNNIKTLNKVAFPSTLRELYLGNNMITTLKNVQFPPTLDVLDMEMDPHVEENEKFITTLKDAVLPLNLRVLRLGYHLIKAIESLEFPHNLEELALQYNDLRVFRNVRFGPKLTKLDLSGNEELMSIENVFFPASLRELKIPSTLVHNLPTTIVERANRHELVLLKSLPYTV